MSLQLFFDNFAQLVGTPNGVQKLRELILQLAVQGKLVKQDERDEPANVLLEKIKKESRLKGNKSLPPISDNDKPFLIPHIWQWTYLGEISLHIEAGWSPQCEKHPAANGEWGVLKISAVSWNTFNPHENKALPKGLMPNTKVEVKVGDFLLSRANTTELIAKSVIVEATQDKLMLSDKILRVQFSDYIDKRFYNYYNNGPFAREYYAKTASGTSSSMKNISREGIALLPVPLPPLEEQKRIVAKVDELMLLCDELETQQRAKDESRLRLNNAILAPLNNAASLETEEFEQALQRLAENFDALYDSAETVGKLRSTIFQLAVQGKLIKQDESNETASILLAKIKEEQRQLIKEGKLKKIVILSPINKNHTPFRLPIGWSWARFPELGLFSRGASKHRPRNAPELYAGGKYKLVQTGDVARANGIIKTYTGLYNERGLAQSRMWPKGTMCITIAANIADSGILGFDACFPDSVVGFIPSKIIGNAQYFEYFMRTAKSHLQDFAPSTAQKNINISILQDVLIPLPPLEEQKRIVAKVNQLMALCDELEAKLRQTNEDSERLMNAAIKYLLDAVNQDELKEVSPSA